METLHEINKNTIQYVSSMMQRRNEYKSSVTIGQKQKKNQLQFILFDEKEAAIEDDEQKKFERVEEMKRATEIDLLFIAEVLKEKHLELTYVDRIVNQHKQFVMRIAFS